MEIRIPKEIREYQQSIFLGLSMRQFIFSILAIGIAIGAFFILRPYMHIETLSWVCILCAFPFGALGFIRYNGMSCEKLIWAYIRCEFIMPSRLTLRTQNTYAELLKDTDRFKEVLRID